MCGRPGCRARRPRSERPLRWIQTREPFAIPARIAVVGCLIQQQAWWLGRGQFCTPDSQWEKFSPGKASSAERGVFLLTAEHVVQEVMGILSTAYDISGLAERDIEAEVASDHSAFKLDLWELQRQLVFGESAGRKDSRQAMWMLNESASEDEGAGCGHAPCHSWLGVLCPCIYAICGLLPAPGQHTPAAPLPRGAVSDSCIRTLCIPVPKAACVLPQCSCMRHLIAVYECSLACDFSGAAQLWCRDAEGSVDAGAAVAAHERGGSEGSSREDGSCDAVAPAGSACVAVAPPHPLVGTVFYDEFKDTGVISPPRLPLSSTPVVCSPLVCRVRCRPPCRDCATVLLSVPAD